MDGRKQFWEISAGAKSVKTTGKGDVRFPRARFLDRVPLFQRFFVVRIL